MAREAGPQLLKSWYSCLKPVRRTAAGSGDGVAVGARVGAGVEVRSGTGEAVAVPEAAPPCPPACGGVRGVAVCGKVGAAATPEAVTGVGRVSGWSTTRLRRSAQP